MRTLFQSDFDYGVMDQVAHRPYPIPQSPWLMTQTWHDVLFLHWPVDAQMLRTLLPAGLEPDVHEGQAYVAVTPLFMTNVAPRGVPAVPGLSSMPEINVRTYVVGKGIPGVYFFSLDAGNPIAVGAARTMFHLPYYSARMKIDPRKGWIHYRSRRTTPGSRPAELRGRYRGAGAPQPAAEGSLEHFLTERYCLYAFDRSFHMYRVDIHHGPWALTPADVELDVNTMAEASNIRLPPISPLAHYAKRQDTVVWAPKRADET